MRHDFVTRVTRFAPGLSVPFVPRWILLASAPEREEAAVFDDWLPFAIYGFFALAIPATMIIGELRPSPRGRSSACARGRIPFESGVSTGPPPRQRFTVSFYLTAMLFILFDIEIVFLYPLAVILHELALVRVLRVPRLPRDPARRLRLHLAEGRARMALDKPLSELGLHSERLLWPTKGPAKFEDEVADLEQKVGLTTLAKAVAWAQTNSMWPDTFGLACCAIEMMSIVSSRYDIARFGMEAFRSSPRQADLLIVSGRVSHKMAAPLRQIYDQMLEPKWVIAMGACASSGGMFNNYAIAPVGRQDRRRSTSTCPAARRGPSS